MKNLYSHTSAKNTHFLFLEEKSFPSSWHRDMELASGADTPLDTFMQLAKEGNSFVKMEIARNDNAPKEVMNYLKNWAKKELAHSYDKETYRILNELEDTEARKMVGGKYAKNISSSTPSSSNNERSNITPAHSGKDVFNNPYPMAADTVDKTKGRVDKTLNKK